MGTAQIPTPLSTVPPPYGEGGLKLGIPGGPPEEERSLPTRGGWIEIDPLCGVGCPGRSLPLRGGWIEILAWRAVASSMVVPPHTGRVD